MLSERGPQGKRHIPAYRDGCYRGRITDCCLLCLLRVAVLSPSSPTRYRIREARRDDDHELVGERVTVPSLERAADRGDIVYRDGTIDTVYTHVDDEPAILTVTTEDDERIRIELTTDTEDSIATEASTDPVEASRSLSEH